MEKIKQKNCIISLILICFIVLFLPKGLQANETTPLQKPIASFKFLKESYYATEPITVEEKSYSPNGNKIIKKEWMIVKNGKKETASHITTLLKGSKLGRQEIFLRVKDSKAIWSDWTSQQVEIKEAEPFCLATFKTEKESYDQGEKINFIYEFDHPYDLTIQSQRWRYRNLTTQSSVVSSKPKYFNKAGTYEVTLELQDEWGNWSNKGVCTVKVGEQQIQRNGLYLFNQGKPGDLLEDYIDKDYNTFNTLEGIEVKDLPGTLIVSNSPEIISSSGILYEDTSVGKGRLVVHHLNESHVAKKLMIVATTQSPMPVELRVKNMAIEGPNKNILKMGQNAVTNYFKGSLEKVYTLTPGTKTCIYDSASIKSWNDLEVISGTLDFESNGPVTWHVVAMDLQSDIEKMAQLTPLPRGIHIRGTFNVIERHYSLTIKDLKTSGKLVLGGSEEEWLVGTDALTGDQVYNKGNYGLPIEIELKSKEDIGIILNARGGSYLGSIKWNDETIFNVPNENILSNKKLAALIGTVKGENPVKWTYMLPNGSSAPVLFGFIPSHLWSE